MKKIFKALAISAATVALGGTIALTAGCATGYNGTYYGDYHYTNEYGAVYGMVVEVTVENNIITNVKNITNSNNEYAQNVQKDDKGNHQDWTFISAANPDYGWPATMVENWVKHEAWLMQQYQGWSVADILDIHVYTDYGYVPAVDSNGNPILNDWGQPSYVQDFTSMGEPCKINDNGGFNKEVEESGLYITNSTQGSGRVLLAVQNALSK